MTRLRSPAGEEGGSPPRPETLQRLAGALGSLTQRDPDEIYHELMRATGRDDRGRQVDLGMRGGAELARYYAQMSALGRHLLLAQARLLARELPKAKGD